MLGGGFAVLAASASVLPEARLHDDPVIAFYVFTLFFLAGATCVTERTCVLLEDVAWRREQRERKLWCWEGGDQHRWLEAADIEVRPLDSERLLSVPSMRRARRTVAGVWASLGIAVLVSGAAFQAHAADDHGWTAEGVLLCSAPLLVLAAPLACCVGRLANGGRLSPREELRRERNVVERGEVISPVFAIGGIVLAVVATRRMHAPPDYDAGVVISATYLAMQIVLVVVALATISWVTKLDDRARRGRPAQLWHRFLAHVHRAGTRAHRYAFVVAVVSSGFALGLFLALDEETSVMLIRLAGIAMFVSLILSKLPARPPSRTDTIQSIKSIRPDPAWSPLLLLLAVVGLYNGP